MKTRSLKAVLLSLCTALVGSALPMVTNAESAEIIEEIVVTGSRIPRPDLVANSPINVVTGEDISLSGVINTETFLNELPQLAPDLTSTTNNGGTGIATVDLRGLGANRTLVLVNGRRYLAADDEGQVDINTIPAPLIERVEVVTGGASAVYGSDAIAGAVNFILKDDFEGVELGGNYNLSNEGDGDTYNINLTLGGNFADDRGNVVLYADHTDREEVLAGARDFSAVALTDVGIGSFFSVGSGRIPGGRIAQPDLVFPDGTIATDAKFLPDGTPIPNAGETYNFQPANFLQTPQERLLLTALGTYAIDEAHEIYFEGAYVNTQIDQQLAFDANDIPDQGPLFVPLSNPFVAANADLVNFLSTNFDGGINGDAVAGDGIASIADFQRRMIEAGPRYTDREFDATRILVGARGDLPWETWQYDVYVSQARGNVSERLRAYTSDLKLQQAINATTDASGNPVCIRPEGNCVPTSLFGLGALRDEAVSFVSPAAAVDRETEQSIYSIGINGQVMDLPAGPLSVAFGWEKRDEEAESSPDAIVQSGELGPGSDEFPVKGSYDVSEFYAEALVPLIADAPLAELVELELAVRFSDYSTIGNVETYKAGGSWMVTPGLRLRGLYQRAVRAPNIFELFQARAAGSESATDLCTASQIPVQAAALGRSVAEINAFCLAQGVPNPGVYVADAQIFTVESGEPNLAEEEADTYTFGFVWTPEFLPGLSLTVDYYDIEVEGAIDDLDADTMLGLCFEDFDVNSPFCQAIDRNPVNGKIEELRSFRQNLASEDRRGIDWQIEYDFELFGGLMGLKMLGNYTLDNEFVPIEGAATVDCNGIFGGDCTGLANFAQPEWRLTNYIDYSRDNWIVRTQLRVIGKLENINKGTAPVPLVVPETDEKYYVDVSAQYTFNENMTVTFGVENVGDVQPPKLGFDFAGLGGGADSNTDPSLYDMIGRRFFLSARYAF